MADATTTTRRRDQQPDQDPKGPLALRDDQARHHGLTWYVREATVGPADGKGMPYAHVVDMGVSRYSNAFSVRYGVRVGLGAKALGFDESRTAPFPTWHAATEAALAFAEKCTALRRTRDAHRSAEREMREALFPAPKAEPVAPVDEAP